MDAYQDMFNLPAEENTKYMDAAHMAPITIGTASNFPLNRNYVKLFTHPDLYCPEKPANLRHGNDSLVTQLPFNNLYSS